MSDAGARPGPIRSIAKSFRLFFNTTFQNFSKTDGFHFCDFKFETCLCSDKDAWNRTVAAEVFVLWISAFLRLFHNVIDK